MMVTPLPEKPVPNTDDLFAGVRACLRGLVFDFHARHEPGPGLVLHGWAVSNHAKQIAQHAAARATGLPILANRIEVRRPVRARPEAEDE